MSERPYYDHEPAYRKIKALGGTGWDDICPSTDSYVGLEAFLAGGLAPAPGARALDLGCGGGQAALRLVGRGYEVSGVDYSGTAIELARKNAPGVDFFVGDCLSLGMFGDGDFDLVVDNHALHCIVGCEDRRTFLQSAARVLRAGGVIFTETMSCEGGFDPVARGINPVTRVNKFGNRFWVSAVELRGELAVAGFEVVDFGVRPGDDGSGDLLTVVARRR